MKPICATRRRNSRRNQILQLHAGQREVSTAEMTAHFSVPAMTILRDTSFRGCRRYARVIRRRGGLAKNEVVQPVLPQSGRPAFQGA